MRVFAIAAEYNMMDLKTAVAEKIKLADRGNWYVDDFARAIIVALCAIPDGDTGMRDIVIQAILSCSAYLVNDLVAQKAINSVDGLLFELF